MKVTDVRIRKITSEGKMKAVVSVTFDDQFVVHDIKIIEGQNGPFIAMPSRKMGEGDFRDIAHPINSDTRSMIQNAIFSRYEELEAQEAAEEEAKAEVLGEREEEVKEQFVEDADEEKTEPLPE
jgi:stage V sporulation protein G